MIPSIVPTSIIIYLDRKLELFSLDFVKKELNLVGQLEPEDKNLKILNLSERFELVWEDMWENFTIKSENLNQVRLSEQSQLSKIYFWLGPESGFTDSRVVFLWLKSWVLFYPNTKFFLLSLQNPIQVTNLNFDLVTKMLGESVKNPESLAYAREPRLGLK